MRWKNDPPKVKQGDVRYRSKFLFLPRTIDGETRWWERSTWRQVAHIVVTMYPTEFGPQFADKIEWRDVQWTDL